jgi:hypothetical protein
MRRLTLLLAILVIPLIHISVNAAIIHVPADYDLIQDAINVSSNGDTVLVEQGLYIEKISFAGHSIVLASNYILSQDTADIGATIIYGPASSDTVVRIDSGESSSTVLCGFHISHGLLGVYANYTSPKIVHNRISRFQNYFDGKGAAILWIGGLVTITENEIFRNESMLGAGIWVERNSGSIHHNIINNNASGLAGGIVLYRTDAFNVYNNTICFNNNNTAYPSYGAVCIDSVTSGCTFYNNIFAYNTLGLGRLGYQPVFNTYNDYYANSYGNFYNCNQSVGEILLDPLFVAGNPYDFTIRETSPCVNSGKPTSPQDPDGSRADMGAIWPPLPIPRGLLGGIIVDESGLPISNVRVFGVDFLGNDTTDSAGRFSFGMQPNDRTYSLLFLNHDFMDTTVNNYQVIGGDTIGMHVVLLDGMPRGAIKGQINDSLYGFYIGNVSIRIGLYGNSYMSDMGGYYFIKKITPGIYDLYFAKANYDTLIIRDIEIASEDTLILNPRMIASNFGFNIIYGNKDGSPVAAVIGAELEIPAWGQAFSPNPADSVAFMHNPLSSNDSIITLRQNGYLPDSYLGRWDEVNFETPGADPFHSGYTNQSITAFAYLYDPPNPENYFVTGPDTELIAVYKMRVANNPELFGDTLSPFCEGYHLANGPLMWGMADGIRTVYPQAIYPTLYFIEPAQVGYLECHYK